MIRRYFENDTTNDAPQITITLYGDATLVGRAGTNSGSLGNDKNIHCDAGEDRTILSLIGRYQRRANQIVQNACEGISP